METTGYFVSMIKINKVIQFQQLLQIISKLLILRFQYFEKQTSTTKFKQKNKDPKSYTKFEILKNPNRSLFEKKKQ